MGLELIAFVAYLGLCAALPWAHRKLQDRRWRRFVARVS